MTCIKNCLSKDTMLERNSLNKVFNTWKFLKYCAIYHIKYRVKMVFFPKFDCLRFPWVTSGLTNSVAFCSGCGCSSPFHPPKHGINGNILRYTWRIIPASKWLIMVGKSFKWGYSPYKWPKWLINEGY